MIRPLLLLSLLAAAAPVFGQNGSELVKAEFRVFPVPNIDQTGILYRPAPDREMRELRFRPGARSFDTYAYRGPPKLRFYREDGLNEDGEQQYRVVGQVDVNARKMLVFFADNGADNDRSPEFSLLAVDDSASAMPEDHVAFLNFTSIPFKCRFMDGNRTVQPGKNEPISVRQHLEDDVFIGLAVTNGDTHRVVLKNRWQFHPGNRHHVLLLPPKRSGSFRIRAYRLTEFVGEKPQFGENASMAR